MFTKMLISLSRCTSCSSSRFISSGATFGVEVSMAISLRIWNASRIRSMSTPTLRDAPLRSATNALTSLRSRPTASSVMGSQPPSPLRSAISSFNSLTCRLSRWMTRRGSTSSLALATLATHATRCANRQVDIDSSSDTWSGAMVATMDVLQFPPSESRNTDVIILLRYGMWVTFLPLALSWSAVMTISKKCSDTLMDLASRIS
mmetsp:Transcript_18402/g.44124  ORF Transcript_18402/g.44124 Transcript_18402/m.44124 type:complete len:204 (-) Transcript_18402:388-999(-)